MIRLIEALNYRCLRYIRRELGPFHVLVGPNASGKTTFLDVVSFLGRLVSDGIEGAVLERTKNFQDLVWQRSGESFELAIEAEIPPERRAKLDNSEFDTIRYEVALQVDDKTREIGIAAEKVLLKTKPTATMPIERNLFPDFALPPPDSLVTRKGAKGTRTVINKVSGGNDNFYDETEKGWDHAFKLGPRKSALGNLPEDESKFPVSTWLKRFLLDGVQQFVLNSLLIRQASRPGQTRGFKPDGSNLPWVIEDLRARNPQKVREWIDHLRTALPDISDIKTVEREDDRQRYLTIDYDWGPSAIPSWMASDGTLRLLALTLPAYLPEVKGLYLIEEPENGIHPRAVETMYHSLSSVYDAQILMATHSPVILSIAEPDKVLCFAKTPEGATDIVQGSEHPALSDWQGETNLGVLFAGGVLG